MAANPVTVEFDAEADILYVKMKNGRIVDTKPLADDVYADIDEQRSILRKRL